MVCPLLSWILSPLFSYDDVAAGEKSLPCRARKQHARLFCFLRTAAKADGRQGDSRHSRSDAEYLRFEVQERRKRPALQASSLAAANKRRLCRPGPHRA